MARWAKGASSTVASPAPGTAINTGWKTAVRRHRSRRSLRHTECGSRPAWSRFTQRRYRLAHVSRWRAWAGRRGRPASHRKTAVTERGMRSLFWFRRGIAGHRPELAWHRDFERLEIVRGAQFVVLQPARDEHGIAALAAQELAALEFQLDPAIQEIDELAIASMVMPAGRLGHTGDRLHDLTAHPAAAGLLQVEVTIAEEIAPSFSKDRLFGAGISELRCRPLGGRGEIIGHRNLLSLWEPLDAVANFRRRLPDEQGARSPDDTELDPGGSALAIRLARGSR